MKMTARTVLKIARLYGLADDTTAAKELRHLIVHTDESFVRAEFTLDKKHYVLIFSALIDDDNIAKLWPKKPETAEALPNPLDNAQTITPFLGKSVILFHLPQHKQRLDAYLANTLDPSISRSLWQKYIKAGAVSVNGQGVLTPKQEIIATDDITVNFPEAKAMSHNINVLYEDTDVVVIDKPVGILTHAKGGIPGEQTVADFLRPRTTYAAESNRPGIVHRLDRHTSGVLIGARTPEAAADLQQQFAHRTVQKTYLAIVQGVPQLNTAQIDLPIGRHPTHPSTFRVDSKGKSAQTFYEVLATNGDKSLIKLQPKTGRTHQLRVHLAHIGTPIIGDQVYGTASERLLLHAYRLEITLPSGERKTFEAPVPEEFLQLFPEIEL
jgi:23S rRNA pseudouridine1911/1915/1917 synthase